MAAAFLVGALLLVPAASAWTPPPPEFPDVTSTSGVDFLVMKWTPSLGAPETLLDVLPAGTPAAGDFNNDGFKDLFLPSPQYTDPVLNAFREPKSRLYMNDGSTIQVTNFIDVTDVAGLDIQEFAYAASWTDVDNDGWLDLFVGGYRLASLFRNNADGTFTEQMLPVPMDSFVLGGAWGDYDNDGFLDLLVVEFAQYEFPADGLPALEALPGKSNRLLRNVGGGVFADVTAMAGLDAVARRSTSGSFVDVDGDGRLDLFVTNYGEPAELWHNNGDGTFTETAGAAGLADGEDATCQAWADFDRDGRQDLYVAHQASVMDSLFRSLADGTFEDVAAAANMSVTANGSGWGCGAFDYDGDADPDVFVAQGEMQGTMRQQSLLLRNELAGAGGSVTFMDQTVEAGEHDVRGFENIPGTLATPRAASGALLADFNVDAESALDIVTTNNDGDLARLFANVGWAGGWAGASGDYIKVNLRGVQSNALGLGARVTVQAGALLQTKQVGAGMSWGGQSVTELHFGVMKAEEGGYKGQARPINVTVEWPSGQVDVYQKVFGVDRWTALTEGVGYQNDTLAPRPVMGVLAGDPGLGNWFVSPQVTVRLTAKDIFQGGSHATDVASMRFSLDGVAWTNVADPKNTGATLTFEGDGTHKLWVETEDFAGNRAVLLYPVRIDTTPPGATPLSPAPGHVYAQGRDLADGSIVANRSVVLVPVPTDFGALGGAGSAVEDAAGSDGTQPVDAALTDADSGVAEVRYRFERTNGGIPTGGQGPAIALGPYEWHWRPNATAAGEYRMIINVTDNAGNSAEYSHRVDVVPTGLDGVQATAKDGPSTPSLGNLL